MGGWEEGSENIGCGDYLGVGGWEELCTKLESGAPCRVWGSRRGGKASETNGTVVREGEGVKDGGARVGFYDTLSFGHVCHYWSTSDT